MNDPGRIVIIGAAPTGLGAAWRLRELGHTDFDVIDRQAHAGGLAASHLDGNGFTWDIGGHVQFSHYAYYDDVLDSLPIEWLRHQRQSWVWLKQRFVPYPFQNNIHRLEAADRDSILHGLELARERANDVVPSNFGEWIERTFGQGMADLFLVPYNRKVWGYPPEMLNTNWVGERVAVPDVERIRLNIAENRDDVSWGPNDTFRFPLHGGTGAIWSAVARRLGSDCLRLGQSVERIDPETRTITLSSGEPRRFDTLISTIPIPELCRRSPALPPDVHAAAESLTYSSTHVFGIGLRGPMPEALVKKCWMYFPEGHNPYYRVTVFSNYSPKNVPAGNHWSLMAEVSESAMKPVDRGTIRAQVTAAMREDGLIGKESEIVSEWHHFEHYGYPTPTLGRDVALETIHEGLEPLRVFSRGRFGAWKYEVSNQDHSFMQGVELVDRLLGVGEEHTLPRPAYANSGVFLRRSAAR